MRKEKKARECPLWEGKKVKKVNTFSQGCQGLGLEKGIPSANETCRIKG